MTRRQTQSTAFWQQVEHNRTVPSSYNLPLSDPSPVKPKCTAEKEPVSSSGNDPIADLTSDPENYAKMKYNAGGHLVTLGNIQKGGCPF